MVRGFTRSGRIDAAYGLLEKMEAVGVAPDEALYNVLLDGCSKYANVELAKSVFKSMEAHAIAPTSVSFNAIIDACVRSD
jgi:pentatricopeptide repeat protein